MPRHNDSPFQACENNAYNISIISQGNAPNYSSFIQQDPYLDLTKSDLPQTVQNNIFDEKNNRPLIFGQAPFQYSKKSSLPFSLAPPKQKRQKFTPEEDEIIVSLVGDNQFPNWNEIASHIKGKTGRQCRERFQHYLSPKISREPWTAQEDQLIIRLYNQYGPNWALIASHFNGKRTNNNIKNRYNNHIKLYKNLVTNKNDKRTNPQYNFNQDQKIAFSPQPQVFPPAQLQQSFQQPFQFNSFNLNENNSVATISANTPNIPLSSFSNQDNSSKTEQLQELPSSGNTVSDDLNEINTDNLIYNDEIFDCNVDNFDQGFDHLDCFSDFFSFDFA